MSAAISGLATRYLARADAAHVVLVGAGRQAEAHLEAMSAGRDLSRVSVIDPDRKRAGARAERAGRFGAVGAVGSVEVHVADADIVCACTTSTTPVLDVSDVVAGRVTRRSEAQLTVFESVGVAWEDLVVAGAVLERVRR